MACGSCGKKKNIDVSKPAPKQRVTLSPKIKKILSGNSGRR